MKFKKKKKGSMGYFYNLSPGDPKLNAEIFNHNMGSNSTTSNSEACSESLLEEDENFEKINPKDYWHLFGVIQNATNQGIPIVLKNKSEIDTIYTSNKNSNRVLYKNEWVDRDNIVDIILKATNKGSDLLINWNDNNIYVDSSTGKIVKNESIIENLNDKLYSLSKELEEIKDDWSLDYLDIYKQSDDEIRIELGCQDKKYLNRHQDEIEDNLNAVIEKYDPMASFNRVGNHFDCYLYLKENINESQKKNEYLITYIDRDTDSVTKGFVKAYSVKQAGLVFRKQRKDVYKILSIECVEDHSKDDGEQLSLFEANGDRGTEELREFICDLINLVCGYYPNAKDFVLHHRNGNHSQNNVYNIILLPNYQNKKNWNTSLHNLYRGGKDFTKWNLSDPKYKQWLITANGIDVYRSLLARDIVDVAGNSLKGRI